MDRIQEQASKLWDLLFDDETAETYQNALNLTGTLLKEFAQLIWLTLISVFVFGAWFSDTSVKAGKSIRDWIDNKGSDTPTAESKPIAETSKDLLEQGRTSVNKLLNQAREQLGLEPQAQPVKPIATSSKPAASSKPAVQSSGSSSQPNSASKPAPMAAQKPPVAAQPSAAAAKAQNPASSPSANKSAERDEAPETSREAVESDWPPQEED